MNINSGQPALLFKQTTGSSIRTDKQKQNNKRKQGKLSGSVRPKRIKQTNKRTAMHLSTHLEQASFSKALIHRDTVTEQLYALGHGPEHLQAKTAYAELTKPFDKSTHALASRFKRIANTDDYLTISLRKLGPIGERIIISSVKSEIAKFARKHLTNSSQRDAVIRFIFHEILNSETKNPRPTRRLLDVLHFMMQELKPNLSTDITPIFNSDDAIAYLAKHCPDCRVESLPIHQLTHRLSSIKKPMTETTYFIINEDESEGKHSVLVSLKAMNNNTINMSILDTLGLYPEKGSLIHSYKEGDKYQFDSTSADRVLEACLSFSIKTSLPTNIGILGPAMQDDGISCSLLNAFMIERMHKDKHIHDYLWSHTKQITSNSIADINERLKKQQRPLFILQNLPANVLELVQNPETINAQKEMIQEQGQLNRLNKIIEENVVYLGDGVSGEKKSKNGYLVSSGLKLLVNKYYRLWFGTHLGAS